MLPGPRFTLGQQLAAFEGEFAAYSDSSHGIGISSGTAALHVALRALGVGPGDEVVTVPNTYIATVFAITYTGATPVFVDVDPDTLNMDPAAVAAAVTPSTVIVSIMHANNEVGTLNPITEIVAAVKAANPMTLVHCDASQSLGKVPVDVSTFGVDYLTVAGHKLYGPKGVGALYIRPGTPPLHKLMWGAGHEGGQRAGTEGTRETEWVSPPPTPPKVVGVSDTDVTGAHGGSGGSGGAYSLERTELVQDRAGASGRVDVLELD